MRQLLIFVVLVSCLLLLSCIQDKSVTPDDPAETAYLWEKLGGGPSRNVEFIEKDPNMTIFAVGDYTLFRSIDNGESWDSLLAVNPHSLMFGPSNRLFVGTGIIGVLPGKIHFSDDGGITWQNPQTPPGGGVFSSLTYSKSNTIFVSSYITDESSGGIFASKDNGLTWGLNLIDIGKSVPMLVHNSARDKIYAAAFELNRPSSELLKSIDEGESWERISVPDSANDSFSCIAVDADNRLFVVSQNSGLISTVDDGENWQFHGFLDQGVAGLYIDERSNIFIFVQENASDSIHLFGSNNSGQSWKRLDVDLEVNDPEFLSITTLQNGFILLGTRENGLLKSTIPVDSLFSVL